MTYQEKYEELIKKYQDTGEVLAEATKKLSTIKGFGDNDDMANYLKAHRNYGFAERAFQYLLNYAKSKNLNPASEYVDQEYMYNYIKTDQQKLGIPWDDDQMRPDTERGLKGYACTTGLTNNGEIKKMIQGTEYKFPVLNIHHGKECLDYLTERLQEPIHKKSETKDEKFDKIDESKQVYVKVEITTWQ